MPDAEEPGRRVRHDYRIAVRARTLSGGGAGVAIPSGDEPVPGIDTCGLHALIGGCKLHEGGAAARPGIVYIFLWERRADDCCLIELSNDRSKQNRRGVSRY